MKVLVIKGQHKGRKLNVKNYTNDDFNRGSFKYHLVDDNNNTVWNDDNLYFPSEWLDLIQNKKNY